MHHTIEVTPCTGRDRQGQPQYGAPVTYRCRIAGNRRLFMNDKGESVTSTHAIWFDGTPQIGPRDMFTLSTDFTNSTESGVRQPTITSLGSFPDERGHIYVVAYANLRYLGF